MLYAFSVSNFLSFNALQTFSMSAGRVRTHASRVHRIKTVRITKCSAVFGPNASGKTSLIKALDFMRSAVLNDLPQGFTCMYYRQEKANISLPSDFIVQVTFGDHLFEYGFSILLQSGAFLREWLFEITPSTGVRHLLFDRNTADGTYRLGISIRDSKLKEKLNVYTEDSSAEQHALFLNIMNQNKGALYKEDSEITILRDLYVWYLQGLDIRFPLNAMTSFFYINNVDVRNIAELLRQFGTGIQDVELVTVPLDDAKSQIPNALYDDVLHDLEQQLAKMRTDKLVSGKTELSISIYTYKRIYTFKTTNMQDLRIETIRFAHENRNIYFDLSEESDGTARLIELLEILLNENDKKVYIIDELDRCLNPMITRDFIRRFLELADKRNAQLIFTTNESTLMDTDLLRRDEICFMHKTDCGETRIQPLESLELRSDRDLFQAYFYGKEFTTIRPRIS